MFVTAKDLNRTADLSGQVAATASRIVEMVKQTTDPTVRQGLLDRAQEMLAISRDLFETIDNVTKANSPQTSIFADMDPELRNILEQIGRSPA